MPQLVMTSATEKLLLGVLILSALEDSARPLSPKHDVAYWLEVATLDIGCVFCPPGAHARQSVIDANECGGFHG